MKGYGEYRILLVKCKLYEKTEREPRGFQNEGTHKGLGKEFEI